MKTYLYKNLNREKRKSLTKRPAINLEATFKIVKPVMDDVLKNGDSALKKYTQKFDGVKLSTFSVSDGEIKRANHLLSDEIKKAFQFAAKNIRKFHVTQLTNEKKVETCTGVTCFRQIRAIEKVGLYVPAGTAPLPSAILMLAIPARIVGCQEIILCTPPNGSGEIAPEILYAANICGIKKIYKVGGAQAIAAMAYGTETIPQVYKIFGAGNQYVTAAKMLVSLDTVAIDMPAGPSELLIIADERARPDFIAADLLSQAEHGADSQVVLLCLSAKFAKTVSLEINTQLKRLPRRKIARVAISKSFILVCENLDQAFEFSNEYAPEHLILNLKNSGKYLKKIINAGSVFLGEYSCESAGDYASGTNHTLPTYGYAKAYSGVSVDSFIKKITFQKLSKKGVRKLGPTVEKMAECEKLQAHKNAMTIRINSLKK